MEEVVVISSDSSNPPSPLSCFLSKGRKNGSFPDTGQSEIHKQTTPRKKPIHQLSSSDDSDNECPSGAESKKSYYCIVNSADCVVDGLPESNSSDIECCYIENSCSQNVYDLYTMKELDKMKDSKDLQSTSNPDDKCNTTEEKRSGNKVIRKVTREELLKEKQEKKLEREREKEEKKLEREREKALKKATSEAQRANRPGECLKNIQVLLDQKLLTEEYGGDILLALQAAQMQYNIQDQLSERSITWVKTVHDYHCDDNMEIVVKKNLKEESMILVVMSSGELVEFIKTNGLRRHIQSILSQNVSKKLVLVIYKLENYYRLQMLEKQRKYKAQCRNRENKRISSDYQVSRSEIEQALIEIQIFEECSHRFVETSQDLGSLVAQFTKALAERVFKLEKQQKEQEKLEWFASGDSRDTVKVDKNGNGLIRLWKQQLCQFHNVSIDTAEAIVSQYSSPKLLIQAYEACSTQKEGQLLLQDIAVRRAAGPLSSIRRVGPELSKKIYNFFTSKDADLFLSQD